MADRPNVVILMTDQQRADLCAREGFPLDTTPFLDRLAREGTWFDRAYTSVPACGPARVSMLTGRYPNATRVRTNHNLADATYERVLDQNLTRANFVTSGQIYAEILERERRGGFLGRDVQMIPHVTGLVKLHLRRLAMTGGPGYA